MRLSSYSREHKMRDRSRALSGNPARDLANSFSVRATLFLALHIPLAIATEMSPWLSTAHALIVLLHGLRAALLGRVPRVLYTVAYIAGAEVLWRMTRAYVLWEYAKYAIVLIIFVALLAEWRRREDVPRLRSVSPLLLLLALVPAAVLTVLELGPAGARDSLSFNLAGYLVLVLLALYLWARPINRRTATRALLAVIAPALGVAALGVYYTLRNLGSFDFVAASNWVTSGSFGPNQVSNLLGLGALAGVIAIVLLSGSRGPRFFTLAVTVVLLGQGLLTFSRGGVYSCALGVSVFGFHLMRSRGARGRFLLLSAFVIVVLAAIIYPSLDSITGGTLAERFRDIDTTGRIEAATADVQAFRENPVAGLGVGQSAAYHRELMGEAVAAHTEFTRLLAEHGVFGIIALALLIWLILRRYAANRPGLARAVSAGLAVWSLSIMTHSAMRVAAIPFALALALVSWQLEPGGEDEPS